jgi:hypothetical protein
VKKRVRIPSVRFIRAAAKPNGAAARKIAARSPSRRPRSRPTAKARRRAVAVPASRVGRRAAKGVVPKRAREAALAQ